MSFPVVPAGTTWSCGGTLGDVSLTISVIGTVYLGVQTIFR